MFSNLLNSIVRSNVSIPNTNTHNTPERWIVIQPRSGIGDVVWHLTAIHTIASYAPSGSITLATQKSSLAKELLSDDPQIEEVIYIERRGLLKNSSIIRKGHFSKAWILHNSFSSALTALIAGIPNRIGYGYKSQRFLINQGNPVPQETKLYDAIEKSIQFLEINNLVAPYRAQNLITSETFKQKLRDDLCSLPYPWISFGIGAGVDSRKWPNTHWVSLAKKLIKDTPATIFVCGGPNDFDSAEWISSQIPEHRVIQITNLPIDKSATLISMTDVFIGNDSGLLNISAATEVSSIGLFGASPALTYLPSIIPITSSSMESITPEIVYQEIVKRLPKRL